MSALLGFFQGVLSSLSTAPLPACSSDMTVHDALRLCEWRHGDPPPAANLCGEGGSSHFHVCRYRSEAELRLLWRRFDHPEWCGNLTVILALDGSLQNRLRKLVARRHFAARLILVPRRGHWPGADSYGDLAMAAAVLGWGRIEIERDARGALTGVDQTIGLDERVLVFLPASSIPGRQS